MTGKEDIIMTVQRQRLSRFLILSSEEKKIRDRKEGKEQRHSISRGKKQELDVGKVTEDDIVMIIIQRGKLSRSLILSSEEKKSQIEKKEKIKGIG